MFYNVEHNVIIYIVIYISLNNISIYSIHLLHNISYLVLSEIPRQDTLNFSYKRV